MAQSFDGPVTIKGDLTIHSTDGKQLVVIHSNEFFFFNTLSCNQMSCFNSGFVSNEFQCGTLKASHIAATNQNNVIDLLGGLQTSGGLIAGADFVVRGTGHFDHDVEVKGDIRLVNADCAEDFTIASNLHIEPGTVVVLGRDGLLLPSETPYDKRVVGVISGAGDFKPGIVLDRRSTTENRMPVALVGKVYCNVDADHGAIETGDLLTTSTTPGHAMKAGDPLRAFGAVIGKALQSFAKGTGLIPILIALQ